MFLNIADLLFLRQHCFPEYKIYRIYRRFFDEVSFPAGNSFWETFFQ